MLRIRNTTINGYTFGSLIVESVWNKAKILPGYTNYRIDICGAIIKREDYGKTTQYGWEIDHIIPVALGGTDNIRNLQPLQWENNRFKSDNYPNWSCKIKGA